MIRALNFNFNYYLFRFLVYDCDQYTRNYFKEMLGTVQPDAIDILGDYYKPTVYTKVRLTNGYHRNTLIVMTKYLQITK